MNAEDLVDKKPKSALKQIERHHASVTNFLESKNYTDGFSGTSLEQAIEIISIASVNEDARTKIEKEADEIVSGFCHSYCDGSLASYSLVAGRLERAFTNMDINVYKAVFRRISSKCEDKEDIADFSQKLLEDVSPRGAHIANDLALFISAYRISESDKFENALEYYLQNSFKIHPDYYEENLSDAEEHEFPHSEENAFNCKIKLEKNPSVETFGKLCFFRAQSRVERERHKELVQPRETHLIIADVLLDATKNINPNINFSWFDSYLDAYKNQVNAMIETIKSNHNKSARLYFKASEKLEYQVRKLKLVSQGFREVAKTYSYENRLAVYENAVWYMKEFNSETDESESLRNRLEREFMIEKRLCECYNIEEQLNNTKQQLREKVGKTRKIIEGDEKFMNEDTNKLERIVEDLD